MLKLKPRSEARLWELLARPSPASCHLQLDKLGGSLHGSKARRLNALNIPYSGVGGTSFIE